jgi:hypothetical protein
MKTIQIPSDLLVVSMKSAEEKQSKAISFKDWCENVIDHYAEGVKTLKQVRQVQKVIDALRTADDALKIEDAEYDLLKASIEAYPSKMPPIVVRQYLPYIDAIEGAK